MRMHTVVRHDSLQKLCLGGGESDAACIKQPGRGRALSDLACTFCTLPKLLSTDLHVAASVTSVLLLAALHPLLLRQGAVLWPRSAILACRGSWGDRAS